MRILRDQKDEFLTSEECIRRWGYVTDRFGTVPFTN
jgi:hypothetical protein